MLHPGLKRTRNFRPHSSGQFHARQVSILMVNTLFSNECEDQTGNNEEGQFEASRKNVHPYQISSELDEHEGEAGDK